MLTGLTSWRQGRIVTLQDAAEALMNDDASQERRTWANSRKTTLWKEGDFEWVATVIVTIARQYGSGGKTVGQHAGQKTLGIDGLRAGRSCVWLPRTAV